MSLLLDALRRAQDARDRSRGVIPTPAAPPSPPPAAVPPPRGQPGPLLALGLAAAIFVGVVMAWHAQPWRAPPKPKAEPAGLKLDHELKMKRDPSAPPGPAGTPRP